MTLLDNKLYLYITLVLSCHLCGCASLKNDDRKGDRFIKIAGIAVNNELGAAIEDSHSLIYLEELGCWPDACLGNTVVVKGFIRTATLPRDTTKKNFEQNDYQPVRIISNYKYKIRGS